MTIKKITDSVFYTGVDDLSTPLFESLWPLPTGVSYNSYFVKGERMAIIDSVEEEYLEDYLSKLSEVGCSAPDYMVVNHMEPDHSGCIPALARRFPDLKFVGNRLTANMLKGYYGIDDKKMHIVNDGDTLDLGAGRVLKFVTIPMVHWPETMVTLLESERVLFSGDAFGTFGALHGRVTDDEISDPALYLNEMYRYYACIVAKYADQVQRAFKKLEGVSYDYICSTHGPVWHRMLHEVVTIYDRLSSHYTQQGVVIAYGSMYGHTEEMARMICDDLRQKGIAVRMHNVATSNLSFILADIWKYRGLIIGAPTYNGAVFPPVQSLLSALELRGLKGRIGGSFGCFTWASAACRLITEAMTRIGIEMPGEPVDMKMSMNPEIEARLRELSSAIATKLEI